MVANFVLRLKKSTTGAAGKKLTRVGPARIQRRHSYRHGARTGSAYGQVKRRTGGGATTGFGLGSLIPNLTSSFGITSPRRPRKRRLVRRQ
jgi:hypothetical protein